MSKVKIEMTPYNALTILSFLKEFESDLENHPHCKSLKEAINNYEESLCHNMTSSQVDDAKAENAVNQMIGKSPDREEQDRLGIV